MDSTPEVFRGQQPTRLETFVDAAFAFALTMLVISVDQVPETFGQLLEALKRVPGFAASFAILLMFWHGHYRWSRRYGIEDTYSVLFSLLLVFLVLVFLYPLRMMMSGALHAVSGGWLPTEVRIERLSDVRAFFFLYGFAFALMSGVLTALYHRARTAPLSPPLNAYERAGANAEVQAWAVICGFGALSATLSLLLPRSLLPFAVWLYACMAVVMPLLGRRWRRQGEAALASMSSSQ
jgi:uncharacterized membrane protein